MHFHQKIYQYLLEYRNSINSNFNFIVRQKTSINDKKYPGGKFAHGLVFQGTEKYCFIALVDRSGGANATKSVGIVISPTKNNSFTAHLEIVFPGETDKKLIDFYENLASKFEGINWDPKRQRAYLFIGDFPENEPLLLYNWLDINFPIIRETALNTGIKDLIPNDDRFEKLQVNLKNRLISDRATINYWIFQGNPNIYDITSALKSGHLKSWKVAAHKDKIQIGDQVIIWQTGDNAGCYALAEVTSEVSVLEEEKIEQQYYKNPTDSAPAERVTIRIIKNLVDDPILWSDIKDDPEFSQFKGGNQGTNFSANETEYNELLNFKNQQNPFFEVKAKFQESVFNNYIKNLKYFISELHIGINDERVVFSLRNDRLNFIIGQRYAFNLYLNEKRGFYGVISKEKLTENSAPFRGKDREVLYTYFKNFQPTEIQLKSILSAMSLELNRTNKSGYNTHNNSDFHNYIFNMKEESKKKNSKPLNQILYGPPGTGKTYNTKKLAVEIIENREYSDSLEDRKIILEKYETYVESELIHFSTFHQSMSYEDFIEGIKPKMNGGDDDEISYEIQDGIFKSICSKAKRTNSINEDENFDVTWGKLIELVKTQISNDKLLKIGSWEYGLSSKESLKYSSLNTPSQYSFTITKQNIKDAYQNKKASPSGAFQKDMEDIVDFMSSQLKLSKYKENSSLSEKEKQSNDKYVLIIDEVNRGNVSAIFGELITLIEADKRAGENETISVTLPYSKTKFSVPNNVYIIGTMNTADRSIEALDTALRRRFTFIEIAPKPELFHNKIIEDINIEMILTTINNRIEILIDKDHKIGHSYFLNIDNLGDLKQAFKKNVIPLLEEYFFGDYGKIGLVLGSGFIQLKNNQEKVSFAKNFTEIYEDAENLREKAIYTFTNENSWNSNSFISIYE